MQDNSENDEFYIGGFSVNETQWCITNKRILIKEHASIKAVRNNAGLLGIFGGSLGYLAARGLSEFSKVNNESIFRNSDFNHYYLKEDIGKIEIDKTSYIHKLRLLDKTGNEIAHINKNTRRGYIDFESIFNKFYPESMVII